VPNSSSASRLFPKAIININMILLIKTEFQLLGG
jgi:hypothetical protein